MLSDQPSKLNSYFVRSLIGTLAFYLPNCDAQYAKGYGDIYKGSNAKCVPDRHWPLNRLIDA